MQAETGIGAEGDIPDRPAPEGGGAEEQLFALRMATIKQSKRLLWAFCSFHSETGDP